MAVKSLSCQEAHEVLTRTPGAVYLDVRSVPEFEKGHPAGATNVPLLHFHAAMRQMVPNPDFLDVVRANFAADTALVVGCQAGPRSEQAADLLIQAGYTNAVYMRGGFGGARDMMGRVIEPGWRDLGLPVNTVPVPGTTYDDLRAKATG